MSQDQASNISFWISRPARIGTGCRPGEAMAATWEQFEIEPGFWVKPSAHTKQRKIHKSPIGPAAIELLDRIRTDRETTPRHRRSNFVFPGQLSGQPLKQLHTTWEEVAGTATVSLWADSRDLKIAALVADLEKGFGRHPTVGECRAVAEQSRMKLPTGLSDARIYDLRHTFASIGAGGGLSLPIIGRLLGHTQARTTQRYSHLAMIHCAKQPPGLPRKSQALARASQMSCRYQNTAARHEEESCERQFHGRRRRLV